MGRNVFKKNPYAGVNAHVHEYIANEEVLAGALSSLQLATQPLAQQSSGLCARFLIIRAAVAVCG